MEKIFGGGNSPSFSDKSLSLGGNLGASGGGLGATGGNASLRGGNLGSLGGNSSLGGGNFGSSGGNLGALGIESFDNIVLDTLDAIYKASSAEKPLSKVWRKVLSGIKNSDALMGQKIFDHTEVALDGGTLQVTTDHPGWAQIIQSYASFIITGFGFYGKQFKVTAIKITVK